MHGAVAQSGERLLCKEEVRGSSPLSSTKGHFCQTIFTSFILSIIDI